MTSVAILLTDNISINENVILKSINSLNKKKIKSIYFIGDDYLFSKIYKKVANLKKYNFLKVRLNSSKLSYLNKITEAGIKLFKEKKVKFLINMPLNKKKFLNSKYQGYTEFFSKKFDNKLNTNMLMYGDHFSVCPMTTHLELKKVDKEITKKRVEKTIENIIYFYKNKIGNKKFQIVVLGLNPHASNDFFVKNKDESILKPIVKYYKKKGANIIGPVSADTAFKDYKNKIFIGMYHDQVLIPFKLINNFNGINITIGKEFIRMSPDHGTATDLLKSKKKINNTSFLKCINFCEKYG